MSTMVGQPPPVVPVARKAPAPFRARLGEYVFVLPALVIVLAVMGYPFVYSIYLSFQATPSYTTQTHFTGLHNYQTLLRGNRSDCSMGRSRGVGQGACDATGRSTILCT